MRVCFIHSGILSQGHIELNSILREVDIIPVKECNENLIRQYDCILIDESQRLYQVDFDCIVKAFQDWNIHCILDMTIIRFYLMPKKIEIFQSN